MRGKGTQVITPTNRRKRGTALCATLHFARIATWVPFPSLTFVRSAGDDKLCENNMLSRLNQRAALQSLALTPDGGGGYSATWQTFATVWATIEPVSGSDVFGPDADESRTRYRITIKRRSDVAAGQRVSASGRSFAIRAVLDGGPQSQFLTLLTETIG